MRVIFISKKYRNLFFENAKRKMNAISWQDLYNKLNISRKTFFNYRSGQLSIPKELYDKLCLENYDNKIKILEDNWGRVKGGKNAYLLNRDNLDNGRKKAIILAGEKAVIFDINQQLSSDLAYFIGLFIGDGFSNKYGTSFIVQFTGHINERNYYQSIVSKISEQMFNLIPKIKKDNRSNAVRVNLYSKCLFLMITKRFKISAGRKSHFVLIPEEILKSEFLLDCIAGIYDAEGCFYFDKRKMYKKEYPIINLHMINIELIKQISKSLNDNLISNSVSRNFDHIYIYGEKNVKNFLDKVKLRNPKILDKIKFS